MNLIQAFRIRQGLRTEDLGELAEGTDLEVLGLPVVVFNPCHFEGLHLFSTRRTSGDEYVYNTYVASDEMMNKGHLYEIDEETRELISEEDAVITV